MGSRGFRILIVSTGTAPAHDCLDPVLAVTGTVELLEDCGASVLWINSKSPVWACVTAGRDGAGGQK